MAYEIEYSSKTLRQLKKLDKPTQKQVLKSIEKIAENPMLAKPLSNIFKNYRSEHSGKHRILFSIKGNLVIVAKIEHRKKVYKR